MIGFCVVCLLHFPLGMSLSAADIRRIFKEELNSALTVLEKKQDAFDAHLMELDKQVTGLEQACILLDLLLNLLVRLLGLVGQDLRAFAPSPFSDDTIECNGWPSTTLRENIKDSLTKIITEAGLQDVATVIVLRKYRDRALLKFKEHDDGARLLSWWREHNPQYANLAGQPLSLSIFVPGGGLPRNELMMSGYGDAPLRSCRSWAFVTWRKKRGRLSSIKPLARLRECKAARLFRLLHGHPRLSSRRSWRSWMQSSFDAPALRGCLLHDADDLPSQRP